MGADMKNHHQAIPSSIESYRQATRDSLWIDHRRKHCFCGAVVTAKQLAQYGACKSCYAKSKTAAEAA
jgi:hypothetical protein